MALVDSELRAAIDYLGGILQRGDEIPFERMPDDASAKLTITFSLRDKTTGREFYALALIAISEQEAFLDTLSKAWPEGFDSR